MAESESEKREGGGVKRLLIGVALIARASSMVAAAQTAPVAAVATEQPVDPARLAAARLVIDQVWPLGTYARIMRTTMDQVATTSMAGMYDMKVDDLAPGAAKGAESGKTMGQIMRESDPAFDQRMKITMSVMGEEMGKLMSEIEPDVRTAMANAYARRFTTAQLNDLHRFFDTESGRIYAAESMTLMMGPDMMRAMQSFVPKLMKAMPSIMAKVAEATKGLPPVVKKGSSK